MANWRHWGWPSSPFSVKTLSYLRFKGLAFQDEVPHLGPMASRIRTSVGRVVLPVVIAPDKTLLQDSSAIIDHIEAVEPTPAAWPSAPLQNFVAHLVELYADEWVSTLAMHTRWSLDNTEFITADFGASAAPWLPGIGQRVVGKRLARTMAAYLPKLGVSPATIPAIEAWCTELLDAVSVHLEAHRFLLGDAPCVADFALVGPLHAHLERDPASTHLIAGRPAIGAWIARVRAGERGTALMADDQVPETLDAVLARCFRDQLPFLADTSAAVIEWRATHPDRKTVARSMGPAPVRFGDAVGQRVRSTYALWMLERVLDAYESAPDRAPLDAWLRRAGGMGLLDMPRPPRLVFEQFQVCFA